MQEPNDPISQTPTNPTQNERGANDADMYDVSADTISNQSNLDKIKTVDAKDDYSAPNTAKKRAVTITEPSNDVKKSGSAKPDGRFSADPALEIRGILKTPTSTTPSAHGRSMSAGSQSIPEINIEGPPPSSQR